MHSHRIGYFIVLAALVVVNIELNSNVSLLLLAAAVFVPLCAVVLCALSRKGVSVAVEAPDVVKKGDSAAFTLVLENRSGFSASFLTTKVSVFNTLTGTQLTKKVRMPAFGAGEQTCSVQLEEAEVGKLFISLVSPRVQDLFRLVSFPVSANEQTGIFVFPKEPPTEVFIGRPLETAGESVRYSENDPGTDVSELYDIRDYVPGDEIRAIHWKLSAKRDREILREFSKPLNYSVVLLVELAASSVPAVEACVTYASAVSRGLLDGGVIHTMTWYDRGTDETCSYNITDYEQLNAAVMRLLSSSAGEGDDASLNRFLYAGEADHDSILIDVTTSLNSELLSRAALDYEMQIEYVGAAPDRELAENLPVHVLPEKCSEETRLVVEV